MLSRFAAFASGSCYPNPIWLLQLRRWQERICSAFHQVLTGNNQTLFISLLSNKNKENIAIPMNGLFYHSEILATRLLVLTGSATARSAAVFHWHEEFHAQENSKEEGSKVKNQLRKKEEDIVISFFMCTNLKKFSNCHGRQFIFCKLLYFWCLVFWILPLVKLL